VKDHITLERLEELRGAPVHDVDGEKIGAVEEIFEDESTGRPEWIGIGTGFLGTKRVLVPVEGARLEGDALRVPYGKDQVKHSPDIDSDEISEPLEAELYSYYGLRSSERRSESRLPDGVADTGLTSPPDSPGDTTEGRAAVTRSEEELAVGKREVETGRARLRKRVETEPVEMDVELRRETARVVREPVNEPVSGSEIGDEQAEVTMREEQPVVQKQAVAKERIGLTTDVETERRTVSDEVRKERVEVDEDDPAR
jgi:uncharacterized protein (TIGR02271 family)